MVEELLRTEIHDMSQKIFELQTKTEHLTNGQRYAVISEIEKSAQILRSDLRNLERQLFNQQSNDELIRKDIAKLEEQINELEEIKSDLIARVNTETEHTRQELNNKIISFMSQELTPIKESIENNKDDIQAITKEIASLRDQIRENEKNREIKEVARFDRFKMILTAVVATLAALSTLSLWLEPSIKTILNVFF